LNPSSVLTGNNTAGIKQWHELVLNSLNKDKDEYVYVDSDNLVGLYIALFTKKGIS
jgi:hypothetical protein